MTEKHDRLTWTGTGAIGLMVLAGLYAGWQIVGLRYTTHDDIFFNLYSYIFSNNVLAFSTWVAQIQARIQAYVNVPIYFAVDGSPETPLYDLINVGSFWTTYLAFFWVLAKAGSATSAACLTAVALLLFPLHYFFTFPQGFPVVGCWTLASAFVSAAVLLSWLHKRTRWRFWLALFFFGTSLFGAEYNFVLHPALILLCLTFGSADRRDLIRNGLPFLVCAALCTAIYGAYAIYHHPSASDAPRTTVGFNIVAIWHTFWTLQLKAFLPTGLIEGIDLHAATAQGVPFVSGTISYGSLWRQFPDRSSVVIVFAAAWLACFAGLLMQRTPGRTLARYTVVCGMIVVIPCAVVSTSIHYQTIVLAGYVQGHLITFYTQLGMAGLLFVGNAVICNTMATRHRLVVCALCGITLAADVTVTFVYNNLNRQVMSANRQKWEAFRQLTQYVAADRPDLLSRPIVARDFWLWSGVSEVPDPTAFDPRNYWTLYADVVLHVPLHILGPGEANPPDDLQVTYMAIPSGTPATLLFERADPASHLTILARRPISGRLFSIRDGVSVTIPSSGWQCKIVCKLTMNLTPGLALADVIFQPDGKGAVRLLSQFLLPRGGAFGVPFAPPPR
jgi:hypothetical protein